MAYPSIPIKTRVTQVSSNEYIIGTGEKYPAVLYIDESDPTLKVLIYCPSMTISFGEKIEFDIKVLTWVEIYQKWYLLNYTPPFNGGLMLVDNKTFVDPNTGEPVHPDPVDDPLTPGNELDNYVGEYAFWSSQLGVLIEAAIQEGMKRRFNLIN